MKEILMQIKKHKRLSIALSIVVVIACLYAFCLPRNLFNKPYATVVEAKNGDLLGARIADDGQWRFPESDSVPYKFAQAIICFEDKRFRQHSGVDFFALARAIKQNVAAKTVVSGASTITMQVIRMSRNKNRNIWQKLIEVVLASRLELRCSKDEILALYASHAPFGGNVVGIDAAAWLYFGRDAHHLSWSESAMLAVMPNAPTSIHLSKNRDVLMIKRNRLLKNLLDENIINQQDYDLAIAEELPSEVKPLPQIAPYFVDWKYQTNKGERILSSIDLEKQVNVEDLVQRWGKNLSQRGIRNLSVIVIDVKTMQPIVYCGNYNYFDDKTEGAKVDVIRRNRSTGSILKPFLYYAMLDEGQFLPSQLFPDVPMSINGFIPENFSKQFDGAVHADEALYRSLNVPFVKMLQQYSVPKFYNFLKKHKVATLPYSTSHYGLSLILGGGEAKLYDLVMAYSQMAQSLVSDTSKLYNAATAWQVFEVLKEVKRPEEIDLAMLKNSQKIAWKTGTSFGFRDAWAIGITAKYVVGVWVGNASGEGNPELIGAKTAGPLLFEVFDNLPASQWFSKPSDGFMAVEVCKKSGHLKGRFCEDVEIRHILPKGINSKACPYCRQINVSSDHRFRVSVDCDEASEEVSCFVLPPVWEFYYKQKHREYQGLPPFMSDCGRSGDNTMQFIYPKNNTVVKLPKQLDGSSAEITLKIAHPRSDAIVFWHINQEFITTTGDIHQYSTSLSPGKYHIVCTDEEGLQVATNLLVR